MSTGTANRACYSALSHFCSWSSQQRMDGAKSERGDAFRPIAFTSLMLIAGLVLSSGAARGDTFTYIDQEGETVEVEARLAGSGQGAHALETADGKIRLVPQAAVQKREVGPDPEPLSSQEIIDQLTERFGEDRFRSYEKAPFVVGLVLADPLERRDERRARGFLRKAADFMKNVEGVFMKFANQLRFPTKPPKYPLVVLIFETDDDFEKYAKEATGERGLSAGNISGFYSMQTNYLAIRLSECHTFEVPLHEAIHQQVYNRHILQRLAPIPTWFNEGIATGFEAEGKRINVGPMKINSRYARTAMAARQLEWSHVISNDAAFGGDVLAGEAYAHAWSLHWFLVTQHKIAYSNFVKQLAQKKTLEETDSEERVKEFEEHFGQSIAAMENEFRQALETGLRRQNVSLKEDQRPGILTTQSRLGEIEMKAARRIDQGGALLVQGRLRNISPIRELSYYVTAETNAGKYADWFVPSLEIKRTTRLKKQYVRKVMKNAPGGSSQTFRVRIRSALPNSEKGKKWKRGQLPVPIYGK